MNSNFKDSPEVIEFRRLFARLKDWSEDDPDGLRELARADDGIQELGLSILKVAGSIQRSEQSGRDLFTGPVDPKFVSEWRDFQERFASALLNIPSDLAAAGKSDYLFSIDYYEEPGHWVVADFRAINAARSLDASIRFAKTQAENALKDAPGLTWQPVNVNVLPDVRRAYMEMAKTASEAEDAHEEFADELFREAARDESKRSEYLDLLRRIEDERSRKDGIPIESGLHLRGVLRRRALIPFVLFPRHVSAHLSNTDLPSIYQNLRQAHDAFVFGAPAAALALMRSVTEMALRDHYRAVGANLSELIDSVANHLPRRANAAALHRLRRLANRILHMTSDGTSDTGKVEKRTFEQEIVSLLFVLRALIEGAPQSSA